MKRKVAENWIFDIMDALRSPILTHSQAWSDCIPKRILDIIPTARMAAILKKEELATFPEAVAFIMTRTMEAPMYREWVNIYTHVCCTVCEQYWKQDHWDELTDSRTLNQEEEELLERLRRWIYEKRRKVLRERMKAEKKAAKLESVEKENPVIEGEQLFLWK